jgi:MtaA/CmuA family methyltransferase
MTPKQRFLAALDLNFPDRIPLLYQNLGGAKWVVESCGRTIWEGFQDPEIFSEIAMASHKLFGFDNVMAGWGDILIEAQAHGTKWKFPDKNAYPRVEAYAAPTPRDIDRIHPVDPMQDHYWSVQLKAAGILQERIGKEVEVVGCINSPFMIASEIMGYENLMIALLKSPNDAHRLLATLTESSKLYADHIAVDSLLDSIFIGDGNAGGDQISPALCTRFDLSYLKQVIDHCRSLGLKTIIHNGASKPYLEEQATLGANGLNFGNKMVDLEKTFNSFRGKLCVIPGIDDSDLLYRCPPDDVEKEVKRTIDLFGKTPGIILSTAVEMPFDTPIENIMRFKRTVEQYGLH